MKGIKREVIMVLNTLLSENWALILGGSSGMGLASAKKLAQHGMNLFIVHRDRRGSMKTIDAHFDEIRSHGVKLHAFNMDALSREGRQAILQSIADHLGQGKIKLLLHSIALGNLKL
ncbi:MAG: SDR family NAD(P)-dependent oxidoreductase, partial [Oligoflexus sp.]